MKRSILAFEALIQEGPNSQYDSGEDGLYPECRSCRFHRPYSRERLCVFRTCPYCTQRVTTERPVRWILAYVSPIYRR